MSGVTLVLFKQVLDTLFSFLSTLGMSYLSVLGLGYVLECNVIGCDWGMYLIGICTLV